MANLWALLGRNTACDDQDGNPVDPEECFGFESTEVEEPSCEEWRLGFQCNTVNLLKKIRQRFALSQVKSISQWAGMEERKSKPKRSWK